MPTLEELQAKLVELQKEIQISKKETLEFVREKDEQIKELDREKDEQIKELAREKDEQIKEIKEKLEKDAIDIKEQLTTIVGSEVKTYPRDHPFPLGSPVDKRSDYINVKFPEGAFKTTPTVRVALNTIDAGEKENVRVRLTPENMTEKGFQIKIITWADSKVYMVGVTWLAQAQRIF